MLPLVKDLFNFLLIFCAIFPIISIVVMIVGKLIKEKLRQRPISEWVREVDRIVEEGKKR